MAIHFATETDLVRIAQFNRTDTPFPDDVTLPELIQAGLERNALAPAVLCDHDATFGTPILTCAQLNERVNQVAHLLRANGVAPGEIVGLLLERSFAMSIGIFATIKAGGAYLPISPANPPDRIAYLLQDAAVKVLLVHNKTASRVEFDGTIINLDNLQIYSGSKENPSLRNKPEDLAYVIYTSGSTGKPKGVMIEHRSVVNRLHWMQRAYPIDETDVILQKTPCSFDVSVWELFWWAFHGAKLCFLVLGGERNPLALAEAIRKHRVTVLHFVPSMLNVFLQYLDGKPAAAQQNLASVRRVFTSGEALSPGHVKKFNDLWCSRTGARLINLYGPTEATVDVSAFDCPADNNFSVIPIGRPIQNTRFHIIKDGQQTAIGEAGELCIAGVQLARGYLNNPALTDQKFTPNPVNPSERIYRTGDLARWLPDGNVEYLGREDDQVKIRGLRIELGEIESTIREYSGVSDCVVLVRNYSENVILIIAYLVCKSDLDLDGLRAYLRKHLPDYMLPNRFEKIIEVPLTPSGKADRKALPEPALELRSA